MMFRCREHARGVLHIQDAMGVCMTLISGTEKALLVDTGYGLENVRLFAEKQMDRPYQVLLTHGHHDHILGTRWFEETWMASEDQEEFQLRTGSEQREKVRQQAIDKGLRVPEDWMEALIRAPRTLRFDRKTGPFDSLLIPLGGLTAEVIRVPGHTPGSCVVYLPERELLLSGDNWNPTTWLWFPSSVGARLWRENMRTLAALRPFRSVLCSHQPELKTRGDLMALVEGMTDEVLERAPKVDMGSPVDTRKASLPEADQELVFDRGKL